jgi:hypothetical protein
MKTGSITAIGAALLVSGGAPVWAEDAPDAPSLPTKAEEAEPDKDQLLEQQMLELKDRLARSEDAQRNRQVAAVHPRLRRPGILRPLRQRRGGLDPRTPGHEQMPQYSQYAWTFLGDILATTINTRGEVADLGDSPGADRFDSVNSNGAPGLPGQRDQPAASVTR